MLIVFGCIINAVIRLSGGSNYKSWTNNPILNAISVCELPIVSLIPCGMIKEIYELVNQSLSHRVIIAGAADMFYTMTTIPAWEDL